MSPCLTQLDYERIIVDAWRRLPCTRGHPPRSDRVLLGELYRRHVPLTLILVAFRLAASRRSPALPPVRSVAYFQPVIDELTNLDPAYLDFLNARLS